MVYSPKISDELIPVLYRAARARRVPMTRLVDRLIVKALAVEPIPMEAAQRLQPYSMFFTEEASPQSLEARLNETLPFRHAWEVEAWYHGCVHGIARAVALHRQETLSEAADGGAGRLLELVQHVHSQSLQFLAPSHRTRGVGNGVLNNVIK